MTDLPTSQFRTHGPAGAGGLETFLRSAEAASLYGHVEIIGGEVQTQFDIAAGRVVIDAAATQQHQTDVFVRLKQILNLVNASATGAYRCGPLLNRQQADHLTSVTVSDLLGPDRRSAAGSVPADAPPSPRPPVAAPAIALPIRNVEHRDAVPPTAVARPLAQTQPAPAATPNASPANVATPAAPAAPTPTPVRSEPSPLAAIRPDARSDTRPLRASQIRRILDSLDEAESNVPAPAATEQPNPQPEPSRRSALRSIIRSLASQ